MSLKALILNEFPELDPVKVDLFIESIHSDIMSGLGKSLRGNVGFAEAEEYLFDVPDWTKIDRQTRIEEGL